MVRELNMASPQSPTSMAATTSEPTTPRTPDVHQHSSLELGESVSEATPKARPTNRLISLEKTRSYYDPSDSNLEYTSRLNGVDLSEEAEALTSAAENQFSQIPDTMRFSSLNSRTESK